MAGRFRPIWADDVCVLTVAHGVSILEKGSDDEKRFIDDGRRQ